MTNYLEIAKQVMKERREKQDNLEAVLAGKSIELWSDAAGRLFIVADEADVHRLMSGDATIRRGEVYSAAELHRITSIADPAIVHEVHTWKRTFDGVIRSEQT